MTKSWRNLQGILFSDLISRMYSMLLMFLWTCLSVLWALRIEVILFFPLINQLIKLEALSLSPSLSVSLSFCVIFIFAFAIDIIIIIMWHRKNIYQSILNTLISIALISLLPLRLCGAPFALLRLLFIMATDFVCKSPSFDFVFPPSLYSLLSFLFITCQLCRA